MTEISVLTTSPADIDLPTNNEFLISGSNLESARLLTETAYKFGVTYLLNHLENCENDSIGEDVLRQFQEQYFPVVTGDAMHYAPVLKLCKELREQHDNTFKELITTLNLNRDNARTVFMDISKMIYQESINWGRVLTLYVFAGTYAVYFANEGDMDVVADIPQWIADVFEEFLVTWVMQNGGWDILEDRDSAKPFTDIGKFLWERSCSTLLGVTIGFTAMGLLLLRGN